MFFINKYFFSLLILSNHTFLVPNSIIILYGCSSSGKTSIATELIRILPGNWKYIPSNNFKMDHGNQLFWKEINQKVAQNYNVIVDTHNLQFLINEIENLTIVVVLLYCSPEKLIEHVMSRNSENNKKNHRELKAVFQEFTSKYKLVKKNQAHIDALHQSNFKNNYGFFTKQALKIIIHKYFQTTDQKISYIAPMLQKYDCYIDTGKISIAHSAEKIKEKLISSLTK